MPERKSYGQYCGLARALDHVGDRWTLLVIRELLLGRRGFRELEAALPGISPTLLSQRIADLLDDGLVTRNDAPARSKAVQYRLTEAGQALEPVLLELIRWGGRWMMTGPGDDHTDPGWASLALRALLDGTPTGSTGTAHVEISGAWVTVLGRDGIRRVRPGRQGDADVTVRVDMPSALAVAARQRRLRAAGAAISGSRRLASALLEGRGRYG